MENLWRVVSSILLCRTRLLEMISCWAARSAPSGDVVDDVYVARLIGRMISSARCGYVVYKPARSCYRFVVTPRRSHIAFKPGVYL